MVENIWNHYTKTLKSMYVDQMDVYKYGEIMAEDGTTDKGLCEHPYLISVPCLLSFHTDDSPESKKVEYNPLSLGATIFCSPQIAIKKGYQVIVRKMHNEKVIATYKGKANAGRKYPTHQQIRIEQVGHA